MADAARAFERALPEVLAATRVLAWVASAIVAAPQVARSRAPSPNRFLPTRRAGAVYPFDGRWRWILAGRFIHLHEATKEAAARLPEELAPLFEMRRRGLVTWTRVRVGVLLALYFGAIAASAGWLLDFLGLTDPVAWVAYVVGPLTGLLAVTVLLVNRLLGQLEVDILSLLALHSASPTKVRKTSKTKRKSRKAAK